MGIIYENKNETKVNLSTAPNIVVHIIYNKLHYLTHRIYIYKKLYEIKKLINISIPSI